MLRLPLSIFLPKWRMIGKRVPRNLLRSMKLKKKVHTTLHKDLKLSRKFAMRVTELLYEQMKKE
jgi:hypothetical protein